MSRHVICKIVLCSAFALSTSISLYAQEAATLESAKAKLDAKDLDGAAKAYAEILNSDDASPQDKATAAAGMSKVRRMMSGDVSEVKKMLAQAKLDIEKGNYPAAEANLKKIKDSGVDLGWYDNERLNRYLAQVAANKASAPAPAEAPVTAAETPAATEAPATAPATAAPQDDFAMIRKIEAAALVADGDKAQQQQNYRVAISFYERALKLDPNNEAAKQGKEQAMLKQDSISAPTTGFEGSVANTVINTQAILAEVDERINEANEYEAQSQYLPAKRRLSEAVGILDRSKNDLPPEIYRNQKNIIERRIAELERVQRLKEEEMRIAGEIERRRKTEERERSIRMARQRQVLELLVKAKDLQSDQNYREALNLLDQAKILDPKNPAVNLMRDIIQDSQYMVEYQEILKSARYKTSTHSIDGMREMIPHTELVVYPSDWPQLTKRRLEAVQSVGADAEANRRVLKALEQTVPVDFEENRFESVIDYLRNTTSQNFYVNWSVLLNNAGIERDVPVNLRLRGIPVTKVMDLVLQQVSTLTGELEPIGWTVDDGIVVISTTADLRKSTITKIYDIQDLLVQFPNFEDAPSFELEITDVTGGGGAIDIPSIDGGEGDFVDVETLIEDLSSLITENVGEFDEWARNGGDVSSMRRWNQQMIIKTTPDNHRGIVELLDELRQQRGVQIHIESRFLFLNKEFFEAVGIDLDFALDNLGSNFQNPVGVTDQPFTETVVDSATGAVVGGVQGVAFGQGSSLVGLTPAVPVTLPQGTNGSANGLSFGLTYLDDIGVSLLVQATQFDTRSLTLTNPRITFRNGQRVYIAVVEQEAFVSDLQPVPNTLGFDPTVSLVSSGTVLDVEATASSDRRFVTVTIRPQVARITGFQQFQIGDPVDEAVGFDFTDNVVLTPITGTIQIPILAVTTIRTTVSIPDRGTVLLGGQKLYAQGEVEMGVPILSKIPWVNRFFTNRVDTQTESTLLILVKPTIILQNETEEDIWPGITSDPLRYPSEGEEPDRPLWDKAIDP